jgi:UDP-glucuronate decarboxylase
MKTLDSLRVAVTGGAGFIGSFLCERLVEENHEVICIDNFTRAGAAMSRICSGGRISYSCGTT